jgi:hypothetical protein
VQPEIVPGKDGQAATARVNAFIGSQPEMVLVRHGFLDGLSAGVQDLGAVLHDAAHDGAHADRRGLAQEYQRSFDDRTTPASPPAWGWCNTCRFSRLISISLGAQPATIARSGWWAPDVLSLGR